MAQLFITLGGVNYAWNMEKSMMEIDHFFGKNR